jgi:hypothetical protein
MAVVTKTDELRTFLWCLAMRQEIVGDNPAIAKTITEASIALESEAAKASRVQNLAIERRFPGTDPANPKDVAVIGENKLRT